MIIILKMCLICHFSFLICVLLKGTRILIFVLFSFIEVNALFYLATQGNEGNVARR